MSDESLLAPWNDRSPEERQAILATLQGIADQQVKRGAEAGMESLSRSPLVDVFAARHGVGGIIVHFLYDYRFWCRTISGSDWDEHHFHAGEAVCRQGAVVSHTLGKDVKTISEYDCPSYDEEAERRKRREAAVAAFRKAWWDLPFPFPG